MSEAPGDARMRALEAVLFVSAEPLPSSVIAQVLETDRAEVERALEGLAARYETSGAGLVLQNVAGGWRLTTHPEEAPVVERFVLSTRHARLTRASLETLAIVAYKQPVTRHQVSAIRGVNSEAVLGALVDRGLIAEVGREEGPGRPLLYATTPDFLERLGLASVSDLPPLAPLLGVGTEGADTATNGDGADAGVGPDGPDGA